MKGSLLASVNLAIFRRETWLELAIILCCRKGDCVNKETKIIKSVQPLSTVTKIYFFPNELSFLMYYIKPCKKIKDELHNCSLNNSVLLICCFWKSLVFFPSFRHTSKYISLNEFSYKPSEMFYMLFYVISQ